MCFKAKAVAASKYWVVSDMGVHGVTMEIAPMADESNSVKSVNFLEMDTVTMDKPRTCSSCWRTVCCVPNMPYISIDESASAATQWWKVPVLTINGVENPESFMEAIQEGEKAARENPMLAALGTVPGQPGAMNVAAAMQMQQVAPFFPLRMVSIALFSRNVEI
uniref:Uncharacterized protein n=1 Tax=Phaeomonas parva TaxID=124430 RepID=A0A6U4EWR9_9STRA|mmetsp:Transcript_22868/g.71022  ORF Transcript_22868/g.71022 Transcript_22868/m.71022 type:complete len:164 (+) Transcript_22868:497-988(+)